MVMTIHPISLTGMGWEFIALQPYHSPTAWAFHMPSTGQGRRSDSYQNIINSKWWHCQQREAEYINQRTTWT